MSWVIVALLAAVCSATATLGNKYMYKRVSPDTMVQVISGGIVGVLFSTVVTVVHGYGTLGATHALLGIVAGLFFGGALTAILYAVRIGDVSQVAPLRLLPPVFVAIIAAIFLHESLSIEAYVGMALIIFGAAQLEGIKNLHLQWNGVLGLMIISGMSYAVMQVISKYLLGFSDPYTVLLYVRLGLLLFTLPLLAIHFRSLIAALKPNPVTRTIQLAVPGILGTASTFLLIIASETGPITLVSTLAATSPFFILLLVQYLGKRVPDIYAEQAKGISLRYRLALVILMFIGVILVFNVV